MSSGRVTRCICLALILLLLFVAIPTGCYHAPGPQERLSAYFNDPLAGAPLFNSPARQAGELAPALLELIGKVKKTLDAAIYSISSDKTIATLRAACERGVRIKLITEAGNYRGQLDDLPCLQLRLDRNERAMHAKFAIFDSATVWTGSANWSDSSLYYDANNAVVIRDRALARAYEREFTQMFAGRYGGEKRDNNGERFTVGATGIAVYFTPSDNPRRALLQELANARESIDLALFYLTDDCLFQALAAAIRRGVRLRAVWDLQGWANLPLSRMDELLSLGVGIVEANPGLVHDKYAVIDKRIVITGSANWTRSGLDYNDEDLLVISDPEIALLYAKNLQRLYQDARDYDREPLAPPRVVRRHYNTQDVRVRVEWRPHLKNKPDFYELCRARDSHGLCEKIFRIPNDHWYFVDEAALSGTVYYYRLRSFFNDRYSDWSNEYVVTAGLPNCPLRGATEECSCADGADNDGDSYTDCRDYDCAAASACLPPTWPEPPEIAIVSRILSAEEVEDELERYRDKLVTVRFYVVSTKDKGKLIYLDSSGGYRENFTAVIFDRNRMNFSAAGVDPVLDYDHRLIEVTGFLQEYNGPEIVLCSPAQVRIVE